MSAASYTRFILTFLSLWKHTWVGCCSFRLAGRLRRGRTHWWWWPMNGVCILSTGWLWQRTYFWCSYRRSPGRVWWRGRALFEKFQTSLYIDNKVLTKIRRIYSSVSWNALSSLPLPSWRSSAAFGWFLSLTSSDLLFCLCPPGVSATQNSFQNTTFCSLTTYSLKSTISIFIICLSLMLCMALSPSRTSGFLSFGRPRSSIPQSVWWGSDFSSFSPLVYYLSLFSTILSSKHRQW